MLPSRGLRPAHFVSYASRQILQNRANGSRMFSSRTLVPITARRTSPLQSATWRTGAICPPSGSLSTLSVRYGSWYAPWSWGSSSTPPSSASDFAASHLPPANSSPTHLDPASHTAPTPPEPIQPVVTSSTPELAPASIDTPAVVDSTTSASPGVMGTIEELLAADTSVRLPPPDPSLSIDHYGQLKEMGLDFGWGPSAFFEYLIEHVHVMTGLGWGGSLIVCTTLIRTCLFYFQAQGSDNLGKLAAMKPLLAGYQKQTEEAIASGNKEKEQLYKMKQQQVGQEIGVKLGKGFQGPLMIGVFGFGAWRCLSGMSHLPVPGMSEAGFLWFQNLTISDPYYLLPALTSSITWIVMKTGGEQGLQNETAQAEKQKLVQNILPAVFFFVTAFQPAGIQFYFFCSTILGGITGRLLRLPVVRSLMRISPLPTKESNEVFTRIVKEGRPLSTIRGKDGKIVYQAPTAPSTNIKSGQLRGLAIKPGTKIPTHFKPVLSDKEKERLQLDKDFEEGMPQKGKTAWVSRHYSPEKVFGRLKNKIKGSTPELETEVAPETRYTRPVVKKPTAPMYDPEVARRKKFQNRGKKQ